MLLSQPKRIKILARKQGPHLVLNVEGDGVQGCSQNFTRDGIKYSKSNRERSDQKNFEFYFCKCGYNRRKREKM